MLEVLCIREGMESLKVGNIYWVDENVMQDMIAGEITLVPVYCDSRCDKDSYIGLETTANFMVKDVGNAADMFCDLVNEYNKLVTSLLSLKKAIENKTTPADGYFGLTLANDIDIDVRIDFTDEIASALVNGLLQKIRGMRIAINGFEDMLAPKYIPALDGLNKKQPQTK